MHEQAVGQILESFKDRLRVRPGTGLSRNMNQSLRRNPEIPVVIGRVVSWLVQMEAPLQFSGVHIRTMHLYRNLVQAHDDWGIDIPVVTRVSFLEAAAATVDLLASLDPEALGSIDMEDHPVYAGSVAFQRKPLLPYHIYVEALAIARRIGLIEGHGTVGLSGKVRQVARRSQPAVAGHTEAL